MLPKRLVVDANILFSFFKPDTTRKHLIEELLNRDCTLISPDFVLKELKEMKGKIFKYSKHLKEPEFDFLLSLLTHEIQTIPKEEYKAFLSKAHMLSPHGADTKDDPYFALALAYHCPIWSDEVAFKEQKRVPILSTIDVFQALRSEQR